MKSSPLGCLSSEEILCDQLKVLNVNTYLQFALQGGGGAVPAALVHHHHHVGQRVHPHLLQLQVLLQQLPTQGARPHEHGTTGRHNNQL